MKLLVENLNNKGNGTNLNRDEETEQSSLQMTNDIQQTNNPNKVSKTVFHPSINLSNRFSFDENDISDQDTVSRLPPHPAPEVISMQAAIGENDVIVVGCHRCSATGV